MRFFFERIFDLSFDLKKKRHRVYQKLVYTIETIFLLRDLRFVT